MNETQYKVVEYPGHERFEELVNSYLNDGWKLHGPMYIHKNIRDVSIYSQAMVK